MMADQRNDFSKGSIPKAILNLAAPMTAAQLVNILYSVVDRIYLGQIPGTGHLALTGLGVTMPLIAILIAFANLCGMGGGPLCSIARGEGRLEHAERIMANAFTMLLSFGLVLTVLAQYFLEPLLYTFGASDVTYPYAAAYARIYIMGTIFVMISLGMNSFINAQGFARVGMGTVVVGAAVNIVLDPVFIFAFDMGVEGAAIATVIAQGCSALWCLKFLMGKKAILCFRLKNMVLQWRIVKKILALGVTGFVMSATNSLVQVSSNTMLQTYGGDLYIGAMTVVNSIREVVFMIVHGLTNGAQPVLGYNYGAKAYSRVRAGIRFVSVGVTVYALVVFGVMMLVPRTLSQIFTSDPAMLDICETAVRIYFCGFILMSLQMAGQCTFVGLGKSRQAVFFSLLRKVFVVVPLVLLLPGWGLGVNGVFWAEPISDLIGGVACFAAMYVSVYKKLDLPDEHLAAV